MSSRKSLSFLLALLLILSYLQPLAYAQGSIKDELIPKEEEELELMRIISPVKPTNSFQFYVSKEGVDSNTGMIDEQIVKDGEVIYEPASPIKTEGKVFSGWYYFDGASEKQIIFNPSGRSDSILVPADQEAQQKQTKVYAKYLESYYVNFIYKGEVLGTKILEPSENFNDDDIFYYIDSEELAFKWWSEDNSQAGPEFIFPATASRDITLYLITKPSYKVTFSTEGGSSILPKYVDEGKTLGYVPDTVRAGYDFNGWKDSLDTDYCSTTEITKPVKLYAQWTPKKVQYEILYFLENAEDDEYTYEKTVEKEGVASTLTTEDVSTLDTINHFTFSHIENAVVKGDGSTVVRAYYTRNKYTLIFKVWGSDTNILEEQVKHGAKTNGYWDLANVPPNDIYGWVNYEHPDPSGGVTIIEAPLMPQNDLTLEGLKAGDTKLWIYFVEITVPALPENIIKTVTTWRNDPETRNFNGGRPIDGFTWKYVTEPGKDADKYKLNEGKYEVRTYYERNMYELNFLTYTDDFAVPLKKILYEGSTADAIPTELKVGDVHDISGLDYIFVGWYKDPGFTDLFDFESETMPAHNVNLYGKWAPTKHTVRYFDDIDGDEISSFEVNHGDTVSEDQFTEYIAPKDFKGWFRKDGSKYIPFVLNEENVLMDMDLYPILLGQTYHVIYKDNGGNIIEDHDIYEYNSRAMAIIKEYPIENALFLGWILEGDSLGSLYYPGDSIIMDSNKTFVSVYSNLKSPTRIIYKAGEGLGKDKTYNVLVNSKHKVKAHDDLDLNYSRPGYEFVSWKVENSEPTSLYKPGQEYLVDNKGVTESNYSANTFIAQWKRITEPKEKLPSTGESSIGLLLFAGIVLLGIGFFLLRKKQR